jgi:hypothetical protein
VGMAAMVDTVDTVDTAAMADTAGTVAMTAMTGKARKATQPVTIRRHGRPNNCLLTSEWHWRTHPQGRVRFCGRRPAGGGIIFPS